MDAADSIPVPPVADEIARLSALVAELSAKLAEADQTIGRLKHEVLLLKRWRFGRRSEKNGGDCTGSLFADLEPAFFEEPPASDKAASPEATPSPKKKPHGRRPIPADLPVERVVVEPRPEEKVCVPCGTEKIVISEEIRREIDYVPGTIFVREVVRPVYACPQECEGQVVAAPPPPAPIEKGLPGPGLLARVVVDKYADHLPLARQVARLEQDGLPVSRQTLCDWCASAGDLLTTFNGLLRQEVLLSKVIHTDDTPVTFLDPERKNKPRTGRLWVYHGDRRRPYTFYEFSPDHRRTWPAGVLAGWTGHLQADAFPGYDALYVGGGIVEAACWAHARRKFKEAELSDGKRAAPILRRIGSLYAIEKSIREEADKNGWSFADSGEKGDQAEAMRQKRRREEAKPILEALKRELDVLSHKTTPKSPMGQATGYAVKNWKALEVYADNGTLAIDNNTAERDIKPVALGRKNYLFYGSEGGGRTAAALYSVIESAKRHRIRLWDYLRDAFTRLPTMKVSELPALLPDRWLKDQGGGN